MRMDRMTSKLQSALADAHSLAVGKDHNYVQPLHLLSVLLEDRSSGTGEILRQGGARSEPLRQAVQREVERLPTISRPTGEVQLSPEMVKLLNLADRNAQKRGDSYIASELVLLAAAEDAGLSVACCESTASARMRWRRPSSPCVREKP
jgi:ATP-dependent Clp protease ATP-binding subunit ClpB